MQAGRVGAQTFTTLHAFDLNDGAGPVAALILSGNTLYGTAFHGGSSGNGTVFKVNTDGTGFTNLHSFTALSNSGTNSDGAKPEGGLILSGNTLYGTAFYGGSLGYGTVFSVNTDGTGFRTLYRFSGGSDGAYPYAGLILSGNTFYGTASWGGSSGSGTVFAINTNGTGFAILHSFTAAIGLYEPGVNSDGANPWGGVILSGNTLYGTTLGGGISADGTVFKVNTDGTGFTTLHTFDYNDGAKPFAGLVLSGNTLYGTAFYGGSLAYGTVFSLNTNGTGFTTVYRFTALSNSGTDSDGANPVSGLILSGNTLYGTALYGGTLGYGTAFKVNTDGTGFTTLYRFTNGSDGAYPYAGLILSSNTLYGAASSGGAGDGTVFSLALPVSAPQLAIIPCGANVIVTWPANNAGSGCAGYNLQSTTNLVSPAAWTPVSPSPVVVNGQNALTNPISGTQQFFRLSQ